MNFKTKGTKIKEQEWTELVCPVRCSWAIFGNADPQKRCTPLPAFSRIIQGVRSGMIATGTQQKRERTKSHSFSDKSRLWTQYFGLVATLSIVWGWLSTPMALVMKYANKLKGRGFSQGAAQGLILGTTGNVNRWQPVAMSAGCLCRRCWHFDLLNWIGPTRYVHPHPKSTPLPHRPPRKTWDRQMEHLGQRRWCGMMLLNSSRHNSGWLIWTAVHRTHLDLC